MNDFTKEELEIILEDFNNGMYRGINDKGRFRKKIQIMIDNYCEHEPSDKPLSAFKWRLCCKCGKEYR